MKNTFTLTLSFLVFAVVGSVQAQTFTVQGTVNDTKGAPVFSTQISLLNATDSVWVQSTVTGENGQYLLSDVAAGVYLIDARLLGYEPTKKLITVTGNTKEVDMILVSNGTQMDELVVTGRKNRIETELGKTIVNISKEMKQGKNLYDLLQDVPGIIISPTGEISIQGKNGVTMIIDDKPVYFTGKSLTEYLKSLDAGVVEQIELMTNPSAKYDAAGNSGVIAIKLTEQKKEGLYGSTSGSYLQGMYPFGTANAHVNYQTGKTVLHISPSVYHGQSFLIPRKLTLATSPDDGRLTSIIEDDGFMLEKFSDYSLDVGADHDISKRTKAGVSVKGIYHPNEETDRYNSKITQVVNKSSFTNRTVNDRGFVRENLQANLFFRHEIDTNSKLVVNGDYFAEGKEMYQYINSTNYNSDGVHFQIHYC